MAARVAATPTIGSFFPRRRPQSILTKLRTAPIFPGDVLVDALPTLTDSFVDASGQRVVTTPALFYHVPQRKALLATGRLDQLESVGRQSPSLIGFAFNNRLLVGGLGGEPQSTPARSTRSATRLKRTSRCCWTPTACLTFSRRSS